MLSRNSLVFPLCGSINPASLQRSSAISRLDFSTAALSASGSCAASYAQLSGGGEYICVTGNAFSSWRCIKDHVQLYTTYLPGLEPVLE